MLAPTLGLLAVLVGIATTSLMISRPAPEQDPDARFWYGFAGLCVLAPLVLGAALLDPGRAAALLAAVSGGCLASGRFLVRLTRRRAAAEAGDRLDAELSAFEARHDLVLRAWCRYELDPAAAIENPSMHDVRVPETSALARALARAEHLRPGGSLREPDGTGAAYRQSVIELESAFRHAEDALAIAPRAPGRGGYSPAGTGRTVRICSLRPKGPCTSCSTPLVSPMPSVP